MGNLIKTANEQAPIRNKAKIITVSEKKEPAKRPASEQKKSIVFHRSSSSSSLWKSDLAEKIDSAIFMANLSLVYAIS